MNDLLRNKLTNRLAAACLIGGLGMSGAAMAVTQDGTVGATSTGRVDVTFTVPEVALINNLNPIAVPTYTSGDAVGSDVFCVWSTAASYSVAITSLNGSGADFVAVDGAANPLIYTVRFNDEANPATGTVVNQGDILPGQSADNSVTPGCAADNAALEVTFPEANIQAAGAALYTDEITLLVSPE